MYAAQGGWEGVGGPAHSLITASCRSFGDVCCVLMCVVVRGLWAHLLHQPPLPFFSSPPKELVPGVQQGAGPPPPRAAPGGSSSSSSAKSQDERRRPLATVGWRARDAAARTERVPVECSGAESAGAPWGTYRKGRAPHMMTWAPGTEKGWGGASGTAHQQHKKGPIAWARAWADASGTHRSPPHTPIAPLDKGGVEHRITASACVPNGPCLDRPAPLAQRGQPPHLSAPVAVEGHGQRGWRKALSLASAHHSVVLLGGAGDVHRVQCDGGPWRMMADPDTPTPTRPHARPCPSAMPRRDHRICG